jgi:hypothetical protein
MHRIVAHAHTAQGLRRDRLETPGLAAIVRRWSIAARDDVGDDAYVAPHERAWAQAQGVDASDGLVPFAHVHAAADGAKLDGQGGWAVVWPVHARVSLDRVTITAAADASLIDSESRALFGALEPLFGGDGLRLVHGGVHRWYAQHAGFATLATASLERCGGDGIERWLPRGEHARLWQRLQNECQMLLHTHPTNAAREARGALPINSLWLSGTGPALQPRDDVRIDMRLGAARDEAALAAAWAALDRETLAPWLEGAAPGDRLTLCGTRASITLAPPARGDLTRRAASWWHRLARPIAAAPSNLDALLREL